MNSFIKLVCTANIRCKKITNVETEYIVAALLVSIGIVKT